MPQDEMAVGAKCPDFDGASAARRATAASVLGYGLRRLGTGLVVLMCVLYLAHVGLTLYEGLPPSDSAGYALRQSLAYIDRLLHGDLGQSSAASANLLPLPVSQVLRETLTRSLGLLGAAMWLATVFGVGLGVVTAAGRRTAWSLPVLLASTTGMSLPSFLAALLLQLLVLAVARLAGRTVLPVGGFGWDGHLILPALVLAARPLAQITRVTFVAISEALTQDYVSTARAKGVAPTPVLLRHVLRNTAVPVLTTIGVSVRFALSSLPLVELYIGWPGAGQTLLKAISRHDADLTVGLVLAFASLFICVNLLLEIAYRLLDPRLRQAAVAAQRERTGSPVEGLAALAADVRDALRRLPLLAAITRRPAEQVPPLSPTGVAVAPALPSRRRAAIRSWLQNTPLVTGTVLVGVLAIAYCFGPYMAPHSPYTTIRIQYVGGTFLAPPFAPGAAYPLGTDVMGRDILSLILAGTQQTLTLAMAAVAARLLAGAIIGAIAGWYSGSRVDRFLLALVEVFAAYPALVLATTVVLAVGIRQGMVAFVIALCCVGWGEVMQFVRGQLMAIRPAQYLEGAVATGVRTPRLMLRHVLPNLLPSLISLAAIEMGSVLMLLGELGFVGIFIGGGAFAEIIVDDPLYHYSDVPEWGSLLSNIRPYARSYPWTAIYPALAFFVAILGLNLFGEGLRRRVEEHGLDLSRLVNRYTVAAAAVAVVAFLWLRDNTGAVAFYRQQAAAFSGERALAHAAALTAPDMQGRALGTDGPEAAADYIADQFRSLGLQMGGESYSYFQTRTRSYAVLTGVPVLSIADGGTALRYRQDFREYYDGFRTEGSITAPVRFVAMGPLTEKGQAFGGTHAYVVLGGLDFTGEVLLVLSEDDAARLARVPADGMLIVSDDTSGFRRAYTLSSDTQSQWGASGNVPAKERRPAMYVSETVADRILAATGKTVAQLRQEEASLLHDELALIETSATVTMVIPSEVRDDVPVRNVVGHMPGQSAEWDHRLVVVLAQYDEPPPTPDGLAYPGANDNASGVAVMLEAARVLQQTGYEPYKTFLFIAYSGEGLDNGRYVREPEVAEFLKAKYGFSSAFEIDTVVRLRGLGYGSGRGLAITTGGNQRLAAVFETAARRMGVAIGREREAVDLTVLYEDVDLAVGGQEAPNLMLTWGGWEETSRLPEDTFANLSADRLQQAGRTLALALMVIGRDTNG